jgi:hypothetical protein
MGVGMARGINALDIIELGVFGSRIEVVCDEC